MNSTSFSKHGRSRSLPFPDNITVVTGLFDADGNFMRGIRKIVELRLLDRTIRARLDSSRGVKNTFVYTRENT